VIFSEDLLSLARDVLDAARAKGLKIATAESCTGGLIAGLLTEIPGSSDVFERGFVTYSNEAKEQMLDVPGELIAEHGAVSAEVAEAMADGAIRNSAADIAVAVTGIAGPGGSGVKPAGLVYIAIAHGPIVAQQFRFGDIGRSKVRLATAKEALTLLVRHI
jgi:nicotinamide-nucleotide amidase